MNRILPHALTAALFAFVPIGFASPVDAQADRQAGWNALEVLERAAERYARLDALCADFTQEMRVVLLNQVTRSEGRICQKQPDLFSMRFTDPEGDRVVADGEFLWLYFPSTDRGQVIRQRLEGGGQGRFDFHREFLSNPGEKYSPTHEGMERIAGSEVHVITLIPTGPSAYRSARVWIDASDWLIRRVRIEEENASIRTVDLRGLELDPTLPADLFRFSPPAGAQIIDR